MCIEAEKLWVYIVCINNYFLFFKKGGSFKHVLETVLKKLNLESTCENTWIP